MLWRRLRTAPDKWLPGPEARLASSLADQVLCPIRQDPKHGIHQGLPIAAHARPFESLPGCWSQVSVTQVHRCDVLALGSFGPCL